MTIFRIDADTLKKASQATPDDKETARLLRDLQIKVDNFAQSVKEAAGLKHDLKKIISNVWKQADTKLKDRSSKPDARKAFQELRQGTDQLWRDLDKLGF